MHLKSYQTFSVLGEKEIIYKKKLKERNYIVIHGRFYDSKPANI